MATIGVIGLGTMGLGIAQVYAAAGFRVIATDAHAPARETAAKATMTMTITKMTTTAATAMTTRR